MYALLAVFSIIAAFLLLRPAPLFGGVMLWVAAWLGAKAHKEDDAVLARVVGWGLILIAGYLLIAGSSS